MRFCVCVWILVVLSLAVTIMEEQWWDNIIAQSLSVLLFLSFSPAFFHPSGQWVTPCCPSAGRRTHYLQLWWHAPPSQHLWLVQACTTYFRPSSKWKSLPLLPGFVTSTGTYSNFNQKMTTRHPEKGMGKQLLKHIFLQLRIECLDLQRTWLAISLKGAECHASHLTNKPFVKSVVDSQVTAAMTLSAFETYIWLLNILPMAIRCAQ